MKKSGAGASFVAHYKQLLLQWIHDDTSSRKYVQQTPTLEQQSCLGIDTLLQKCET